MAEDQGRFAADQPDPDQIAIWKKCSSNAQLRHVRSMSDSACWRQQTPSFTPQRPHRYHLVELLPSGALWMVQSRLRGGRPERRPPLPGLLFTAR